MSKLTQCKRCSLFKNRTQVVFQPKVLKKRSKTARVVFIGEAPGKNEDIEGAPFVGPAGEWLGKIIKAMGLKEKDYYIANTVKCRPVINGRNGHPTPLQVSKCSRWLDKELNIIKPNVIITLGGFAKDRILGLKGRVSEFAGRMFFDKRYKNVFVMYHPASILYNKKKMIPIFKKHIKVFKVLCNEMLLLEQERKWWEKLEIGDWV